MNAVDADTDAPPPSLWRDLAEGRAGWFVRLLVCIAVGIFLVGGAMMASYMLAGLVPGLNRRFYNYMGAGRGVVLVSRPGVYPKEGLIATMMLLAAALWIGSIVWLFFRGARQGALVRPILMTLGIIVATVSTGALADSTLRGDQELVIIGVSLVGAAAVLILWVQAIREMRSGRPLRNRQDQLLDIRCPECGYRMVGLHESRCPECGQAYTLDELLSRQDFARPTGSRPVTNVIPPPPPPIPVAMNGPSVAGQPA